MPGFLENLRWKSLPILSRSAFLRNFLLGFLLPLLLPIFHRIFPVQAMASRKLRPPGALPEKEFLDQCIGCGQCANVCPNGCISLSTPDSGLAGMATPEISARAKGCILCMACTQVCPTDALAPLQPTEEGKAAVNMGIAVVQPEVCYSYAGRTCGVCYRACPLPGKALRLGLMETPIVNPDHCVGCGLCEQSCVHMPQAIRVIPAAEWATRPPSLRVMPEPPSPFVRDAES